MMEVIIDGKQYVTVEDVKHMPNLPQTLEQALWMQRIGYYWIEDNSPDKLTEVARQNAERTTELAEALEAYFEAEEIDDPAIRLQELAACRTQAKAALKKAGR